MAGLGALALGASGPACGGTDPLKPSPRASGAVQARDNFFEPKNATVRAGRTVTWRNTGATIHTVKGRGFFSQAIDPGGTYRHRFGRPGRYRYVCTLHPGMTGIVVVR